MKVCVKCQRTFADPAATICDADGAELYPELSDYTRDEKRLAGRVLGGRYLIESLLGEGGMGVVLRARHVYLDKPVAIKVLHPELTMVEEVRARFLREAQAASAIRDPHIVEVTDFGLTTRGLSYLVMEYLEGKDLFAYFDQHRQLSPLVAAHIGIGVCESLQVLHDHGFVHRDLKPENVWVLNPDAPPAEISIKLLDFGIVGLVTPDEESEAATERLTRTGRTLGTPNYMAPEQVRGAQVDGRADVYALGCILWELVTGRQVVQGSGAVDILTKQLLGTPDPPSEHCSNVPAWFDAVVLTSLQKSADDRYQSADEMAHALRQGIERGATITTAAATPATTAAVTGEAPVGPTTAPTVVSPPPVMAHETDADLAVASRRSPLYLVAAVALLILVGGGFLLFGQRPPAAGITGEPRPAREAISAPDSPGPALATPAPKVPSASGVAPPAEAAPAPALRPAAGWDGAARRTVANEAEVDAEATEAERPTRATRPGRARPAAAPNRPAGHTEPASPLMDPK